MAEKGAVGLRVAAISLAEADTETIENYATSLAALLSGLQVELAVLPAYTAFLLWMRGVT